MVDETGASNKWEACSKRLKQRVLLTKRNYPSKQRRKRNRSYSKEFLDKIKPILNRVLLLYSHNGSGTSLTEHGMKLSIEQQGN